MTPSRYITVPPFYCRI